MLRLNSVVVIIFKKFSSSLKLYYFILPVLYSKLMEKVQAKLLLKFSLKLDYSVKVMCL